MYPRLHKTIITVISLLLISFFAGTATASEGRTKRAQLPSDLADFVSKSQELLMTDSAAFRALAEKPEYFSWLDQRTFRGQTNWKLSAMPLPKREGRWLAVFSDFHTCESIGDHIHTLVKATDGWRFGPEISERDTKGYRVRDHNLRVTYDLPNSSCRISDDLLIERTSSNSGACLLRLSSDMTVDEAKLSGKTFPVSSVPGLIVFQPPTAARFTLHLAYHGKVNHPGSDYITPTETVLCSYWYPHIGRLPARHGVTATVPKGWTAVGEGELLKRSDDREQTTFTFRNEIPTCYFTLDAGPYVITSRMTGKRKLSVYELKPQEGRAQKALDSLEKCLDYFEKSFGTYPYTHYEVVETVLPFGGALEAYSFSTYSRGLFGAVVHEVAHTWWGGIVPCPYTKTMWNESFASYSDGLFYRQTSATKPERALTGQHQDRQRGRSAINRYPVPISEAFDTSNGAHSSAGYGKGSLVLSMLEDLLGTETMIKSMRRFRDDHKPGDAADWPDFQRAVNKVTGKDYGWFFDQWINRKGLPMLKLANVQKKQESGGYVMTGEIILDGEPYRLFVPVTVEVDGGEPFRTTVEVKGATTPIRITMKSAPKTLTLDPAGNLLIAGAVVEGDGDPFRVVVAIAD